MQYVWNSRREIVCAVALALMVCPSVTSTAEESVVVLRNGGVLHGKVSTSGERYEVTRSKSVVEVPTAQVLLVADSMLDAYHRQRQQLPRDTSEAHLGLADWCLRYSLLDSAAQELADARRLDPRDPRAALLERRLAVAREAKTQASGSASGELHEDTTAKDELRKLEAVAADLSPSAVERFTRKVQPLLVNSCTTSGCHHPGGEQSFQLDRAVLHGLSNRRITLRNLVATLELVNRDSPQQSDLLSIPRRTHGGMKRPVFGPRQKSQLEQLVDWVGMVTESEVAAESEVTAEPVVAEPAPTSLHAWSSANSREQPPQFVDNLVMPTNVEEMEALLKKQPNQFGAELTPWAPKDEFDPEIFNRQQDSAAAESTNANEQQPATR
jgi:hypothetical protein